MKKHKGILIDPEKRTVENVEVPEGLDGIYDAIACQPSPFTCVRINERNVIYADDEGLFKDPRHFTEWTGYPHPLCGKLLILGLDEAGDTTDTDLTTTYVMDSIRFTRKRVLGFEDTTRQGEIFGRKGTVISRKTLFEDL